MDQYQYKCTNQLCEMLCLSSVACICFILEKFENDNFRQATKDQIQNQRRSSVHDVPVLWQIVITYVYVERK